MRRTNYINRGKKGGLPGGPGAGNVWRKGGSWGALFAAAFLFAACHKRKAPPAPPADAAFLAGAWSPSLMEGTPRQGGEVVVRIPSEPPSLNLLIDSDLWLNRITKPAVYETLLRRDGDDPPTYPLKPCLAERYEVSPDHLTYTFHLRHGVRFHDGQPFSARDVIATFDKLMDPKVRAQTLRADVAGLTRWKALGDFTVQFTFREPYFLALRQLASAIPILPAGVLDRLTPEALDTTAAINRAPIGTGPWKLERWDGGEIRFVRNPDYWDTSRVPHLDRLIFRVVSDQAVAYQLMLKGELDVVHNLQPDQWLRMPQDAPVVARYHRFRYYDDNYGWVGWNERRPFFADERVRRALAELFDQDAFDQNVLHGLERRTQCIFYFLSPACDPGLAPIPYDPAHARALLREAGWADRDGDGVLDKDGVPFRFTFLMPSGSAKLERLAPVLQDAYRRAGIDMAIQRSEWALFVKRLVDHDFDAVSLLWGSSDVEQDPYQVWHASQIHGGSNYIFFQNPEADRLIEAGRRELDPAQRNAAWRALGRLLYDEQPYMWLTVRPELDAVKRTFRGVRPSICYYDFSRWWIAADAPR